ncbi:MAG: PLP-dependent aminotransferase family protein [Slackia sp.]
METSPTPFLSAHGPKRYATPFPRTSIRSDFSPDCRGTKRLREAIAWHIRSVRGLETDPDCIVVGAGAQVLYNLIIQLLERPEAVALEDPGYGRLASIYEANGIRISPVPLDSKGISSEALRSSGADLAHITPSHQFPTGIVMPASRRYELLAWATEKPGRYIVEDDYDCEFRLAGKPIPFFRESTGPNASSTRTPSRKRSSAFRIAYMVLPAHLARVYRERMGFYSCTVPAIDQMTLARFIEQGDLDRHINQKRGARQPQRSIEALQKTADPSCRLRTDSGLFLMVAHVRDASSPEERHPGAPRSHDFLENAIADSLETRCLRKLLSSYRIKDGTTSDSRQCRLVISYRDFRSTMRGPPRRRYRALTCSFLTAKHPVSWQ